MTEALFYCYLNLESTKTLTIVTYSAFKFYCYLNLESTKTLKRLQCTEKRFTVT